MEFAKGAHLVLYNILIYGIFFGLTAMLRESADFKYAGGSEGSNLDQLSFSDAAWYTMVTHSTVGYGDIYQAPFRIFALGHTNGHSEILLHAHVGGIP